MTRQWPVNYPEKKLTMELFSAGNKGYLPFTRETRISTKTVEKSIFHHQNDWSRLWFGKPVLTFGKRPIKG